jgi:hypothetical protein
MARHERGQINYIPGELADPGVVLYCDFAFHGMPPPVDTDSIARFTAKLSGPMGSHMQFPGNSGIKVHSFMFGIAVTSSWPFVELWYSFHYPG